MRLLAGDQLELRGPIGGWFVWRPDDPSAILLVAGGSGVVPLMAMIRERDGHGISTPFRLVYSVRTPHDRLYAEELATRAAAGTHLTLSLIYTRTAAGDAGRPTVPIAPTPDGTWLSLSGSASWHLAPTT